MLRQVPPRRAALLDAGHLEPELGRLDGGHVAARAAADDHQIVRRLAHDPVSPALTHRAGSLAPRRPRSRLRGYDMGAQPGA